MNIETYRTPASLVTPHTSRPWTFLRPLAWKLYPFFGNNRFARRWLGGKWEKKYVEPCRTSLWLPVKQWGERYPLAGPAFEWEEYP